MSLKRTRRFTTIETRHGECRYYHMDRISKSLGIALLLAAACGRPADVAPGTESVGVPVGVMTGLPLDRVLAELESKLDSAVADGPGSGSTRRLAEVEAMTDHLVETELPFPWLGSDGYSVEARLRQIQAVADRIMSGTRGAMDRATMDQEIQAFRDRVHDLRQDLARGGGPAPVPVADLLRAMDTIRR